MNITPDYKRHIRIEGKPNDLRGYMLTVHDVETGEPITNITRIVVSLGVGRNNQAEITYYEKDEHNEFVIKDNEPVKSIITVDNPEIAVTAYEHRKGNP